MTDQLPPVSPDQIGTLVDQQRDGLFVVAFCPICDRTEQAPAADEQSREYAAAASIAKIRIHIKNTHRPRPQRVKIASVTRPQYVP